MGNKETENDVIPSPRTDGNGYFIYDQAFFLALARLGKEVWNRWRAANSRHGPGPYVSVTFEGIDFRYFKSPENAAIDFSGFSFGDRANFHGCQFEGGSGWVYVLLGGHKMFDINRDRRLEFNAGMPKFTCATFGDNADFGGVHFGQNANFAGAIFGQRASFEETVFGSSANFVGTTFGAWTSFGRAKFANGADFCGAAFEDICNFSDTGFEDYVDFSGAVFGGITRFEDADFGGPVQFTDMSEQERKEIYALLTLWASSGQRPKSGPRTAPNSLISLMFSGARFANAADFSGRQFRLGDFTSTIFLQPPHFDRCEGTQHIDFYSSRVRFSGKLPRMSVLRWKLPEISVRGWTTSSNTALQIRKLRKLAEETKNHDLERDLYIEERKAERGIVLAQLWRRKGKILFEPRFYSHCVWIMVMGIYWLLAD
jgi:uncharacterized protein YjbI with pentapeptide repeats